MKFRFWFSARTGWLLIPCLTAMALAIYLLRSEYVSPFGEVNGAQVGVLRQATADVRRKPAASYLWSKVEVGAALFSHDALQTGNGGSAEIELMDGSRMQIGEQTMVILDEKRLGATRKDEKRNTAIVHRSTQPPVREEPPARQQLLENSSATGLSLKSPLYDQYYVTSPTPFLFAWNRDRAGDNLGNRYTIEVATDPKFQNKVATKTTVEDTISSEELGILPGKYFWRVRITDYRGRTVKSSQMAHFAYGLSPVLTAPRDVAPQPGRLPSSAEELNRVEDPPKPLKAPRRSRIRLE